MKAIVVMFIYNLLFFSNLQKYIPDLKIFPKKIFFPQEPPHIKVMRITSKNPILELLEGCLSGVVNKISGNLVKVLFWTLIVSVFCGCPVSKCQDQTSD